jgi:hypothetical protein
MKTIPIGEAFTLKQAHRLWLDCLEAQQPFHPEALKMVTPLMDRINAVTGQENDPRYWAYMLEFVITEYDKKSEEER